MKTGQFGSCTTDLLHWAGSEVIILTMVTRTNQTDQLLTLELENSARQIPDSISYYRQLRNKKPYRKNNSIIMINTTCARQYLT